MFANNICNLEVQVLCPKDDKNTQDIQVIDQAESNEFCMGENGFHRSFMSQLMHAESEELRLSLMQKLTERNDSSLPEDISAADAIRLIKPRNVQTAASCRDWMASLENTPLSKAVDEYQKSLIPKEEDIVKEADIVKNDDSKIVDNV